MKINHVGEYVYSDHDIIDLVMQGRGISSLLGLVVDHTVDLEALSGLLGEPGNLSTWHVPTDAEISIDEYDSRQQNHWFMPPEYRDLDIAKHVLRSCCDDAELQRVGQELLMFQERDMFDLLRYLKYLVDVMRDNNIVWGVGRGSCVASFVLYKLGVHRVNSLYYDLDPAEFLR
jgi:hypothetical protein